jgi:hypothetical protein
MYIIVPILVFVSVALCLSSFIRSWKDPWGFLTPWLQGVGVLLFAFMTSVLPFLFSDGGDLLHGNWFTHAWALFLTMPKLVLLLASAISVVAYVMPPALFLRVRLKGLTP